MFDTLNPSEQAIFQQILQAKLAELAIDPTAISVFFDARHLPCPMPLLKAKLNLRSVADGKALYLLATDKNSQHDLMAFCQKNSYITHTWQSEQDAGIVYHFIIQKP